MSNPFEPVRNVATRQRGGSIEDAVEECHIRTAEALHLAGAATQAHISHAVAAARESHAENKPLDLLEALARIQGHDEELIGGAIVSLGEALSFTESQPPPLIPFAGKLIAPSGFYESFDNMHKLGRALLTPVIYAEDTDAIGVASVNPVAATILAEEILHTVHRRIGIRPFITIARLDYESWTFLCRKHFGV